MQTLRGIVRHSDLEGGVWLLEAEDGMQYQLVGAAAGSLQSGQRVEAQGEVDTNLMSFAMAGILFTVKKIVPAP